MTASEAESIPPSGPGADPTAGPTTRRTTLELLALAWPAVLSYTLNNAYAAFEEDRKGSLVPGKLADVVVLSRDIMTAPEDELPDARVAYTILGGRVVYQADAPEPAPEAASEPVSEAGSEASNPS